MPKHKKLNLFDDDDGDDQEELRNLDGNTLTEDFQLKISDEKLSDERTSKLIELQSKFAYDSRFKIDERFVEDENDDEDLEQDDGDDEDQDEEKQKDKEIQQEKLKNLSILENVLGKSLKSSSKSTLDSFSDSKRKKLSAPPAIGSTVLVPRFDPTKEETKIYEIDEKVSTTGGLSSKRGKLVQIDFDDDEIDQKINTKKVQLAAEEKQKQAKKAQKKKGGSVSEKNLMENYYEISSNLKESLSNNAGGSFSFGSLLGFDDGGSGNNDQTNEDLKLENETSTYEPLFGDQRKRQLRTMKNPFKYDSSDSEDEESFDKQNKRIKFEDEDGVEDDQNEDEKVNIELTKSSSTSSKAIPTTRKTLKPSKSKFPLTFGGFFFTTNDQRLEDDQFYSQELVEKVRKQSRERSIQMSQAFRLRKLAALKNAKTEKKYTEKQQNKLKMIKKGRKLKHRTSARFGFARRTIPQQQQHVVITKPTKVD